MSASSKSSTFVDASSRSALARDLDSLFGHPSFRPGQAEAVRSALERRDVLVVQSTGNGKSLVYQLPTLVERQTSRDVVTLVVSPLVSLMSDQCQALNARFRIDAESGTVKLADGATERDTPVAVYLGSAQPDPRASTRALDGEFAFVYVTPEKLPQWITVLPRLVSKLLFFAVDECHCISAHGLDFRPAYRDLHRLRHACPSVPILALTATATEEVRGDVATLLGMRDHVVHCSSFDRPNLNFRFQVRGELADSLYAIRNEFRRWCADTGVAIVYVLTKKLAESLAKKLRLSQFGISAEAYHSGMDPGGRAAVAGRFRSGETRCVVATIAFGMGVDQQNVRLVVHYGMSRSVDAYVQEAGRAGRDGEPARCLCLYSDADVMTHSILSDSALAKKHLRDMFDLTCKPTRCRRARMLRYFDEAYAASPCVGGCDACDRATDRAARAAVLRADKDAALLLQVAREIPRGAAAQVNFLLGKGLRPSIGRELARLYGVGKRRSEKWWKAMHRDMAAHGLLERCMGSRGGIYYKAA